MATCGVKLSLGDYGSLVCDRQASAPGRHTDSPTGPKDQDGNPVKIPADQHYYSAWQTSWPVS